MSMDLYQKHYSNIEQLPTAHQIQYLFIQSIMISGKIIKAPKNTNF